MANGDYNNLFGLGSIYSNWMVQSQAAQQQVALQQYYNTQLTTGGWTGTTTTTIQGGGGAGGAGGGGLGIDWQPRLKLYGVLTDQPTREPEIVLGLREEGIGLRKKWKLH